MLKLFQSIWVTIAIGVLVFAGTVFMMWQKMPKPAAATTHATAADEEPRDTAHVIPDNVDLPALVEDLHRRERKIEAKEKELVDWETRLRAAAADLKRDQERVTTMLDQVATNRFRIKEAEADGLRRTAETLAGVSPEGAVSILASEPVDYVAKILFFMKKDKSKDVLDAMQRSGEGGSKRVGEILKKLSTIEPPADSTAKKT